MKLLKRSGCYSSDRRGNVKGMTTLVEGQGLVFGHGFDSRQVHSYNKKWELSLPFFVSLKQLLLKISSLAKSRIENSLSDTERNRGNLEQLIDVDEVECLFQT